MPLARKRLLYAPLFAWLQIVRVPLKFLDYVVLLDFALEAAQGVFQRFAFLQPDFSQLNYTSQPHQLVTLSFAVSFWQVKWEVNKN
jgi:hypothetical protein